MMPHVINIKDLPDRRIPEGAVYVGRAVPRFGLAASVWGNPFTMRGEWDRERVITEFRAYALDRLEREPDWLEPLRGKDLSCWCHGPEQDYGCHADILIEYANRPAGVA